MSPEDEFPSENEGGAKPSSNSPGKDVRVGIGDLRNGNKTVPALTKELDQAKKEFDAATKRLDEATKKHAEATVTKAKQDAFEEKTRAEVEKKSAETKVKRLEADLIEANKERDRKQAEAENRLRTAKVIPTGPERTFVEKVRENPKAVLAVLVVLALVLIGWRVARKPSVEVVETTTTEEKGAQTPSTPSDNPNNPNKPNNHPAVVVQTAPSADEHKGLSEEDLQIVLNRVGTVVEEKLKNLQCCPVPPREATKKAAPAKKTTARKAAPPSKAQGPPPLSGKPFNLATSKMGAAPEASLTAEQACLDALQFHRSSMYALCKNYSEPERLPVFTGSQSQRGCAPSSRCK